MIKLLNQERGFTIIEALIAQVILLVGATAIWSMFVVGSRLNAESEDKTVAANIAQLKVEEIMNTRFRYIVEDHPPGVTAFDGGEVDGSGTQGPPFWTLDSKGQWRPALPEGKYEISYPDGLDADPLRIKVTISWLGRGHSDSSLSLETLVSMTPGRFRG